MRLGAGSCNTATGQSGTAGRRACEGLKHRSQPRSSTIFSSVRSVRRLTQPSKASTGWRFPSVSTMLRASRDWSSSTRFRYSSAALRLREASRTRPACVSNSSSTHWGRLMVTAAAHLHGRAATRQLAQA